MSKGLMNRYNFACRLHNDRVILILKKGKYYSYGDNAKILNYIKFRGNIWKLKDNEISYMVIENLDVVECNIYNNDNYKKYILLSRLSNTLDTLAINFNNKRMESLDAIQKKEEVG